MSDATIQIMRNTCRLSLFVGLLSLAGRAQAAAAPDVPRRAQVVEALAPFGFWIPTPGHGLVWRPTRAEVGPDFTPFVSGGKWMQTDHGQVFASRWSWGHTVFESGVWTVDDRWGWLWIPPGGEDTTPAPEIATDEGMPLPSLLPPLKIRSISHPQDVDFAYPLGADWGRRLPDGTEIRYPQGPVGSDKNQWILVPEARLRDPVLRFQALSGPPPVGAPPTVALTGGAK